MLQLTDIREKKEHIITGLQKRNFADAEKKIDAILTLDNEKKRLKKELDTLLQENNEHSKAIALLMQSKNTSQIQKLKEENNEIKNKTKKISEELIGIEKKLNESLYEIPNIPHKTVPNGKSAEENEIIFQTQELPILEKNAKPHWEIIKEYDLIDFELGTKITGSGFPVYKNDGARLVRALINYFLDMAIQAGYNEIQPPILINAESGFGTGQLPDKEAQMYYVTEDALYLIPTAEVPITNLYRDVIVEEKNLPIKNVGYTPCFRREAGSWGAHVRGLNRLHQFDKVEIVQITKPDNSYKALEEMKAHVEMLLKNLELPYRILRLCAGDMGFTSALTYDFEVYSAAQQKWLEVSSVSNFETFQANRLKLRYKTDKKNQLLHTLNGSALALPRIMAAIYENNQTPKGILIPKPIIPYIKKNIIEYTVK